MPLMELVPFSANLGGLAPTLVGLAWIARTYRWIAGDVTEPELQPRP